MSEKEENATLKFDVHMCAEDLFAVNEYWLCMFTTQCSSPSVG